MSHKATRSTRRSAPLDPDGLRALALHYVARYATSRGKLQRYLERKLRERGWDGDGPPDVEAIVRYCAERSFVDDTLFGEARAETLSRRGYGARRIRQQLGADGLTSEDAARLSRMDEDSRWDAADRLARKRRIGPYASAMADPDTRRRQIATFLRAGHDMDMARRFVDAAPGALPSRS